MPLERYGERLFARAAVGGRDVGYFLIDTGAAATFIDSAVADELGLPEVVEAAVGGMHAETTGTIRKLSALSIGGVELATDATIAVEMDELSTQAGVPVAGVIGYPTLGDVPFTIDFPAATLTFWNPARFTAPNVESALLRVNANAPFVEATLENGTDVWLMLDSGAAGTVALWRTFVDQHPDVVTVPQKRWGVSSGAGGGTQVAITELRTLRVFGREVHAVTTAVQAAPEWMWVHPRVAGLVGASLLRDWRITIDPQKRRIWAEPA
jgi:hypothetical protein